MHDRTGQGKVGYVGHSRDVRYRAVSSCKSSTVARKIYEKCTGSQLPVFYCKIYGVCFTVYKL